jgi:hypothetical protein
MTTFRATFAVDLIDGKALDPEFVRTALEEALEDVASFFASDDEDHEAEYGVEVGVVEVVA